MSAVVHHGDCLEVMRGMADNSVDSIVTDPPYGISFMSKKWDHDVPSEAIWREALRVLKPGGHLLAFFGSRTYHRGVVRIEDAGFAIRDQIMWVFGGGFPKSHNLTGEHKGFGTALKPAHEPLVLARKPLVGTVAQNVQAHGTGAINIDGCRVEAERGDEPLRWAHGRGMGFHGAEDRGTCAALSSPGRWPANFIHDGSDEVLALFPETGASKAGGMTTGRKFAEGESGFAAERSRTGHNDSGGSAARFFYTAKASRADRGKGNTHSTVKPTDLMRYLVRLITPPSGTVLDPFCGSGSTLKAVIMEGFDCIGIELDEGYAQIARDRVANAQPALLGAS